MQLAIKILYSLIIILLIGCKGKDEIEFKKYDTASLQKDISVLKGIVIDMHAGVYAYNSPAQINYIFDSVQKSITSSLTIREFYNKVDYLIDRLRCIHTVAYMPQEYYDSISIRPIFFPTPLIDIDDKLYVNTDLHNIPLGAEVVSINDLDATKIISDLKNLRHADGYSNPIRKSAIDDDFAYNYFLKYGGSPSFNIQFIRDSSIKVETENFTAEKLKDLYNNVNSTTFYYYSTDVNYDFEIDDAYKTATLTIRTFHYQTSNSLHAFNNFLSNSFRLLKQNGIKNLIIDCRNNAGGYYNSTYSLLSYLVNEKIPEYDSVYQRFKTLTYTQFMAPEDTERIADIDTSYLTYNKTKQGLYKLKDEEITIWEPQENIFKGKLFVIVNGNVASAAATLSAILKDKTNATIVGEETGGGNDAHNAAIMTFVLPNSKIKIDIPLRRYFQPVIKKWEGRGVIPAKSIPFTVQDLINNRDSPLSYIYDSLLTQ